MSEPSYQAPPPPSTPPSAAAPPKKKGLSPLAWVGIGCGALVVLGLIAMAVAVSLGVSWLGGKAKEFEENPAMASAKMLVRINPEIELVDSDDAAGTLTIRNKKTGELVTVGLDEIEQGRITFESDGETITMGLEEGDDGEGAFTVRDREGKTRFRVGAGGESELPDWVPRYRETQAEGTYISTSNGSVQGGFTFSTGDSPDDVLDYFRVHFEREGFEITGTNTFSTGDHRGGTLSARSGDRSLDLYVMSEGRGSRGTVTFAEKP